MNSANHGAATALGFGIAHLLAGTALLLQELDLLTLNWSYLLPLILIPVGAASCSRGSSGNGRRRPVARSTAL